jgi:ribonuclease HII
VSLFSFDHYYRVQGNKIIAGVDEAGRGPWAGPVVAAAVVLPPDVELLGLNDSKKLTRLQREKLFIHIKEKALAIGVEIIDQQVIDSINILQATYRAMRGALQRIPFPLDLVLIDGLPVPELGFPQKSFTGGDGKSASIAAASIIAKVTRDAIMCELAEQYPLYNFHKHKGYGTPDHTRALNSYGPCPVHRKSFAPVRACLMKEQTV